MRHSPRLAFDPLPDQEAYALKELQGLLAYLTANSPFYKEILAGHTELADNIGQLSDLRQFPFTTKQDVQERYRDFLCVPRSAVKEYMATSGTMGKPVTIALSDSDLERLAYNEHQSFLCADGHAGETYQLALTLDRQFMAGIAYYSGIRAMGAAQVRTGPGLPQMQWETIERLRTDSLVAVPSFLLTMAEWAKKHGIDPAASPVVKAICIGESVRRPDFSLNVLGQQIADHWPIRLYNTYAATELQTAFTECGAGVGGHHQPDLIIVEIIDDAGCPVPDGTAGEVVITTLGIEAMPLLRYRTGDIATLHAEPCACGRRSKRLGPVIGRKGQMIKYRGTTLYPPAVFDVLNEADYVTAYVVEVFSTEQETDDLLLHVHTSLPQEECDQRLRSLLQARLRVVPQVRHHSAAEIEAMRQPSGARKPVRFIDSRVRH